MTLTTASVTGSLERYYRLHARIYDVTRWSFLFGRKKIIELAAREISAKRILEAGCGTGANLLSLSGTFPGADITGVDLSEDMLRVARDKLDAIPNRVRLLNRRYDATLNDGNEETGKYDLILFSYALSMFNPGWEEAIETAKQQLSDQGIIAVVDFHDSQHAWFRDWMRVNHVEMKQHLLPVLQQQFMETQCQLLPAYKGLWQYLMFTGTCK